MTDALPDDARAIVAEEEALLSRAVEALRAAAARAVRRPGTQALVEHLKELRDEAASASARDLPALFQEMRSVRALADRELAPAPPEPGTPYFAHLRLRSAKGARDFLLGRATFIDTAADVRIVDWRFAPVARMFYGYGEGDEYEEQLPGGLAEGVVEARRVVVVEGGVLTRILAGAQVLVRGPDSAWSLEAGGVGALGGGSGTAARAGSLGVGRGAGGRHRSADVTALLSPDQFEALSVEADRPLLVLGSAGSGKTTVALHRLAQLAFDDRARFAPLDLRVVVPEEGLARLSRRLLAPLGLEKVRVQTLAAWLEETTRAAFSLRALRLAPETPALVSRLKRHPALRALLVEQVGPLTERRPSLPVLKTSLAEAFSDRSFLGRVVDAANGELPRPAIDATVRHTMLQVATPLAREFAGTDEERLQTVDGRSMSEGTPDALAGTLDLEDLALLLYFRARAGAIDADPIAHLVLDETEDFSLFELSVLARQLDAPRSCTLAGDEVQQTQSGFAGWDDVLAAMGFADAAVCRLQTSYRCPRPVVELAQRVLGTQAPAAAARAGREGVPVGFHAFPDEAQAQLFLATALRDLMDRERDASVGVIASSVDAAAAVYRALEEVPGARLVLRGDFSFEPGIDVTDVDSVKGLEFDYVIVADATAAAYPDTPEARRRLHVAVTRASHQLWLLSSGRPSPLVELAVG